MKKAFKLGNRGFSHVEAIVAVLVVVGIAAIGARTLFSHAQTPPNVTTSVNPASTLTGQAATLLGKWRYVGSINSPIQGDTAGMQIYACKIENSPTYWEVEAAGVFSKNPPAGYNYAITMVDQASFNPKSTVIFTNTSIWNNNDGNNYVFDYSGTPITDPSQANYLTFQYAYTNSGSFQVLGDLPLNSYTQFKVLPFCWTGVYAQIATPTANEIVSGTVHVTDTIASKTVSGSQVTTVQLQVNGNTVATSTKSPFDFEWNSKTVPDGYQNLELVASDSSGILGSSQVKVIVNN